MNESSNQEAVTVGDLLATIARIELWLQALRQGLEALPQDLELKVEDRLDVFEDLRS